MTPASRLRVLSRLSFYEDRGGTGSAVEPASFHEAGAFLSLDIGLLSWLSLSGSVLGRAGLPTLAGELEHGASVPAGIFGTVSLRGEL